jgi:hypothetical protein
LSPQEARARLERLLPAWLQGEAAPGGLAAFRARFLLAEEIKAMIEPAFSAEAPPLQRQRGLLVLRFLDDAFSFHQRPVPDSFAPGMPKAVTADLERPGLRMIGLAYARVPPGGPLQPLVGLALTDANVALRCVARLAAWGALSSEEAQAQVRTWQVRTLRLQIADAEAWRERAQARGDDEQLHEEQVRLARLHLALGEGAAARRWADASRPYLARCGEVDVAPDPLSVELQAIEQVPTASAREAQLRALLTRADLPPVGRVRVEYALFLHLLGQRSLAEAESLGQRLRPQIRARLGAPAEQELLFRLLEAQRARGDIGRFEITAAEYERVRRGCAGAAWRGPAARILAEVALALGDLQGVEEHVKDWIERRYYALVRGGGPVAAPDELEAPEALLLLAQVHRERGRLDEAERILSALGSLPNLSVLALGPPVPPTSARAAAFLNPALAPDLHEWLAADPARIERFSTAFRRWGGGAIVMEEPLTSHGFTQRAAGLDHGFVYAHASFRPDDPLASYVRFASDRGARAELTARDLVQARLGPGLWVFAACSTGVGRVRAGDEVLGLPRALLQAGARSVVISLWDVGSGASLDLMTDLYTHMARGRTIAGALRAAAGASRAAGRSPFDWAPFIVVGQHDLAAP